MVRKKAFNTFWVHGQQCHLVNLQREVKTFLNIIRCAVYKSTGPCLSPCQALYYRQLSRKTAYTPHVLSLHVLHISVYRYGGGDCIIKVTSEVPLNHDSNHHYMHIHAFHIISNVFKIWDFQCMSLTPDFHSVWAVANIHSCHVKQKCVLYYILMKKTCGCDDLF